MALAHTIAVKEADSQELLTGEELQALGDIGPCELIEGEIRRMLPADYCHGLIEIEIAAELKRWAQAQNPPPGRVLGGEVGIYTRRDPNTVRGADVVYISNERLERVRSKSFLDVAPELVVEILSADDRWSEVMAKIGEYLDCGVDQVWIVDPDKVQISVYRSLAAVERFDAQATFMAGDLLPGFEIPVADFLGRG